MGMVRSWLVTAAFVVVFLGFTGFVAVVVTGHAPPHFTEKVRQTVRDTVQRVMRLFSGHHMATGATGEVFWPLHARAASLVWSPAANLQACGPKDTVLADVLVLQADAPTPTREVASV